jgi:AcrR family transcriptional regulator
MKSTKTLTARRRRRSSTEIMDGLLAAATAEFSENGYAGATTAAIARRGAVTEAQLFRYFPSKADLFREAVFKPMREHIEGFVSQASPGNARTGRDMERAGEYITELQGFLRKHSRLLMSLITARVYEHEARPAFGANSLDRYFERGAATLAEGLGRGSGVAPELMVRVSFAAVLSCVLLDDWLFPDSLATPDAINEAIKAFVVHGISAPTLSASSEASRDVP